MRDKMVTLTFMVMTIMLSGAKAVPDEITQQPPGIEENTRQVAFAVHFSDYFEHVGEDAPMVFNVVLTNIGNGYNNYTGAFTAPTNGTYTFSLQIMNRPDKGWIEAAVVSNGRPLCKARTKGREYSSAFCTTNVHLNKGERVVAKRVEGSFYVYGNIYSMFTGAMVSYDIN